MWAVKGRKLLSDTHTKNCGKKIIQASRRTDYYRVHICRASTRQDFCAQWRDFMFLFTFSEEFTGCCHGECCSCPGYPFIFTSQTILPIDWLDAVWQSVTMLGLLTVWVRFLNSWGAVVSPSYFTFCLFFCSLNSALAMTLEPRKTWKLANPILWGCREHCLP